MAHAPVSIQLHMVIAWCARGKEKYGKTLPTPAQETLHAEINLWVDSLALSNNQSSLDDELSIVDD